MLGFVDLGKTRARGVVWPNMPPCHGGDRRFESGRARQIEMKSLLLREVFLFQTDEVVRFLTGARFDNPPPASWHTGGLYLCNPVGPTRLSKKTSHI